MLISEVKMCHFSSCIVLLCYANQLLPPCLIITVVLIFSVSSQQECN